MYLIGYCNNGYCLWDADKKTVVSRSVVFDESNNISCQEKEGKRLVKILPQGSLAEREDTDRNHGVIDIHDTGEENQDSSYEEAEESLRNAEVTLRRSQRRKNPPKYLEDFEMNLMAALSAGYLPSKVPSTYKEAIESEDGWKEAINEELKILEENRTWKLVSRPPNVNIIDSRWVFTKKIEDNGESKKRARLVARRYQQPVLDEEAYAPVARMMTLRVLLVHAVENDLDLHQMNVRSAFLKSKLNEDIYIYPPDGLNLLAPGQVCK